MTVKVSLPTLMLENVSSPTVTMTQSSPNILPVTEADAVQFAVPLILASKLLELVIDALASALAVAKTTKLELALDVDVVSILP